MSELTQELKHTIILVNHVPSDIAEITRSLSYPKHSSNDLCFAVSTNPLIFDYNLP